MDPLDVEMTFTGLAIVSQGQGCDFVEVEHSGVKFLCTHRGLLCEGHRCFSGIDVYITDTLFTADNVAEMRPSWWKAQAAFRGLDLSGGVAALQARLQGYKEAWMLDELKGLERKTMVEEGLKEERIRFPRKPRSPPRGRGGRRGGPRGGGRGGGTGGGRITKGYRDVGAEMRGLAKFQRL